MIESLEEVIKTQSEIIKLESDIIDELFIKLAENINTEDLFAMPAIDKMNKAVEMRESIGEDILEDVGDE